MGYIRKGSYISEGLVLIYTTIAHVVRMPRTKDLGGQQTGAKVWDANGAWKVVDKPGTGKDLQQKKRKTARVKFKTWALHRTDAPA